MIGKTLVDLNQKYTFKASPEHTKKQEIAEQSGPR